MRLAITHCIPMSPAPLTINHYQLPHDHSSLEYKNVQEYASFRKIDPKRTTGLKMFQLTTVLSLCLVLAHSVPTIVEKSSKIVGGTEAEPGSVPYQVSIQLFGEHTCGGVIYNNKWIITAAHCLTGESLSSVEVWAGVHNIHRPEEVTQKVKLVNIIGHPQYDLVTFENDIALLELDTPLNLGVDLRAMAIDLPPSQFKATGMAQITGWGSLNPEGPKPAYLQTISIPILTDEECRSFYPDDYFDESMLCAGQFEGTQDSCFGDGGGPVVVYGDEDDGQPLLAGIVSSGWGCGYYPSVHTEVAHFREWIETYAL